MRGRALTSVPPGLPWRSLRLGCSYVAPISPASICMCALPLICFLLWPSFYVFVCVRFACVFAGRSSAVAEGINEQHQSTRSADVY